MPYADDFHRSELLERICESARWRLGEEQAAAITPYLHHYYARVGLDEIAAKGADALFGAAFAHWRFGERRQGGRPSSASTIPVSTSTAGAASIASSRSLPTTCRSS